MENAAQAIILALLLVLGFVIVRSGGRWTESPAGSTRKPPPETALELDRTSTSQPSPRPVRTVSPVAEQNRSLPPFNQSPAGSIRKGPSEKEADQTSTSQSPPLPASTATQSAPQEGILPCRKSTDYTIGWICAILTEYVAAQEFLDEEHERPDFTSPHDTNNYTLGTIGGHNVVIAVLPAGEYGIAAAATVATNMQRSFPNVRIGLMVGIGGGVPSKRHDIRLGDVVVSAPRDGKGGVFQYDFGKTVQDLSFQYTGFLNQPPTALRTALTGLQARYKRKGHRIENTIESILNRNPGLRQEYARPPGNADTLFKAAVVHDAKGCAEFCASNQSNIIGRRARATNEPNPAIHYGLIASANQVMKNAKVRDQLAAENDILCFEMEAAGLMNQFPCIVIRGICDYSDSHKNKEWQGFAAMTAAAYAKDMICEIRPSLIEAEKRLGDILLGLHDTVKENQDLAKQQLKAQNDFAKERLSDKEEKCHQLFRLTSDSGGEATYEWYKNRVEERVDNTCKWFLQHENFQKWLQSKSGPLFVSADPGCGKSVLARYLVDSYLPRSVTICYFFFKDKLQDRVRQALCALLHQLFSQKPHLIKHAMLEYSKDGEGLVNSTESLWKVLRNATGDPQAGPIIMVLDALDECRESELPDLTRNLESQFHKGQGKLKYLMTCRPYESIVSRFGSLLHTFPNIHIPGEEESETISHEVNHVITYRVNQLSQKKNLSSDVQQKLDEGLRKSSHRTYLWVYLVFNYLEEEHFKKTAKGAEAALKLIPQSVNAAYEQILSKSKDHSTVGKVLSIILAATRPLTLPEMNIAVNVDERTQSFHDLDLEDEENFKSRLRTLCGLFISIYQGRIHFLHQTAREFLLGDFRSSDTVLSDPGWYHSIAMTQAHEVLATVCVRYLDFLNSDTSISANAGEDDSNILGINYDFLNYSAKAWTTHFREADICPTAAILPSALRIYDPGSRSYATWFDIFWHTEPSFPTIHNFSNLMLSSYCGHYAIAKELIEQGADVDSKDSVYGQTPLSWAVGCGHLEVVKLLIQTGKVDIDSKDKFGQTPLLLAAVYGYLEVVKLLIQTGKVDIDSKDSEYGRTPLSLAAENGHLEVVKLLIQTGKVDIDSKDSEFGQTPLSWAAENWHKEVVKLLRQATCGTV
ncbi:hypothetical protein ASPVEDRAFT_367534 [Aspergillus versicolor CBS 583.65]|uniref:Uncharacterized protein n=1 Tax=Aspergillus versicolor CBS 583.65 TaxID=1036611 RepID=A0A1L9Q154_ASPVE|nr:uncharacterized protein ASPVEDRAFT_367534 [Aspergillus versicolor CBS 583.65]OJJ07505.1 hypothetical protein ASPVEDRAFT_367534 [Aspergillus versicolor CBS 583.65]